jgi:ABC-type bacteriocin/lantibiotic exporter with double-glycine peptidase domain
MVASYYGHRTDLSAMRLRLSPSLKGITLKHIAQIGETMGMTARGVQVPLESLGKLRLPAILHWDMNHFVVLDGSVGTQDHRPRSRARQTRAHAGRSVAALHRRRDGVHADFGFQKKDEREKIKSWQLLSAASGLKGTIAQILLLSFALEVFAIAMPFFLQLTVDRVLVGRDRDLLTVLGIAFCVLVVIQVAVAAVRAWVGVYLSTNINLKLLTTLFNHMLRLPLSWFEKRNIGDIVSKFRSVDAIQRTLTTTFVETAVDGLMVILTIIVMSYYSLMLTGVVLTAAVLYGIARWIFYYPQRYATDEQLAHEARSGTHFIETLRGMMAIKLNLRESERRSSYQNLVVDQTNAGVRVQNVGILQRAANMLIFGLEGVIVIWLAALLVMEGKFTVGMLYAFIGFKLLFLTRVVALNRQVERVPHARPARRAHRGHRAIGAGRIEACDAGRRRQRAAAHRSEGAGLCLRARGIRVQECGLDDRAGRDGRHRRALPVREDHADQGAAGLLQAHGGRSARQRPQPRRLGYGPVPRPRRGGDAGRSALRRHDRGQHQLLRHRARSRARPRMRPLRHDRRRNHGDAHAVQHHRRKPGHGSLGRTETAGPARASAIPQAQVLFLDEAFDQIDVALERRITAALGEQSLSIAMVSHRDSTALASTKQLAMPQRTASA